MTGDMIFLLCTAAAALLLIAVLVLFYRAVVRGKGRHRWWTLLIGNALMLAVLLAAVLLGLELYFRFAYDTTVGDNRSKVSKRWFDRHWVRNARGVRDNIEYDNAIPPGLHRITFVGDSFTAGHGVTGVEDRFVNRVRRALAPGWQVHALSTLGLDTAGESAIVKNAADNGYEFDVVVLVYLFNDIRPLITELQASIRPAADLPWWVEHSYALNTLYYRSWARGGTTYGPGKLDYTTLMIGAYNGSAWQRQRRELERFKQTVEQYGGRLAAVTFPWLRRLIDDDQRIKGMHDKLDALWQQLRVPHLDLLSLFEKHRGAQLIVNHYDAHPSVYAHALAANAIIKFMADRVTPPPPPN